MNDARETSEVAALAARLVAEEGLEYAGAKRKAAQALSGRGGGRGPALPSDEELEDAIREHIAIFCAEEQPAELRALRELALGWMQRLAEFRPHLAGAAWRGTATRHSALLIDLYCDDPKAAEIALINANVRYDSDSLNRPGAGEIPVLTVMARCEALGQRVRLHLALHEHDALRGALRADARGRSWRGDAAALVRLLAAEADE
jgi:hypothetical protein